MPSPCQIEAMMIAVSAYFGSPSQGFARFSRPMPFERGIDQTLGRVVHPLPHQPGDACGNHERRKDDELEEAMQSDGLLEHPCDQHGGNKDDNPADDHQIDGVPSRLVEIGVFAR